MTSASSAGASVITLQFNLALNLDVAEQNVQQAINAANSLLPTGLPAPPVYAKVNPADQPILTLAVTSKSMSLTQLQDVANNRLASKISEVPGVGLVSPPAATCRRSGSKRTRTSWPPTGSISTICARCSQHQRQPAQGQFRRPGSRLHHQRQRPDPGSEGLPEHGDRLPERLAGVHARRRQVSPRPRRTSNRAPGSTHAGHRAQRAAPAGRERDRHGRPDQEAAAAALASLPQAMQVRSSPTAPA
jgi:hypothetical protein